MSGPAENEPAPKPGTAFIADLVIEDINDRVEMGEKKYGTRLQANNGRDALWDLYQELIDAVMYVRQEIAERQSRDSDRLVAAVHRYLEACGRPRNELSGFVEWLNSQSGMLEDARKRRAAVERAQGAMSS